VPRVLVLLAGAAGPGPLGWCRGSWSSWLVPRVLVLLAGAAGPVRLGW
jgi:hypothetical protein